jgi:hypothetical protein
MGMEVGAELRTPEGQKWVAEMAETNTLLGAIVEVIHPTTFSTGAECIKAIGRSSVIEKAENLKDLMKVWTTPFPAASLINNRNTPLHRDNGATLGSMDFLTSVGPFEYAKFKVPGLGCEFLFKSGTVIGLLGRIVPHAADTVGERFCYAQYLREIILAPLDIEGPQWVNIVDVMR